MKRFCLLFILIFSALFAQSPTGKVTLLVTSIQVADTSGSATLNCTLSSANHLQVAIACTAGTAALPAQSLDVSQAGESVTYSLNLTGNAFTGIFTQGAAPATAPAITFQVTANGSPASTGQI